MELKQYLDESRILLSTDPARPLGQSKRDVLSALATVVSEVSEITPDVMFSAVEQREKLMSTGIGQGIAVPHVRLVRLHRSIIALAVHREGIDDYESLDGEPVHIVVLIAAPKGQHETYIRLLAMVVEIIKEPRRREAIIAAETTGEVFNILTEEK